jgi:succinate dehydrogenase / fumarate reductase, iron-sulfur subunit
VKLKLRVWRQGGPDDKGRLVDYQVDDADADMSFLELLDVLNEKLILGGDEPVAFDHDCREGICGMCSMVVNGYAHGPEKATTVCQLHLRHFSHGETITVEPWRSAAFPVLKDLVVDRGALDRIIAAGGYVSAPTGSAPEAAAIPVPKPNADRAFTAAACIGCGACVAACPNGSASLFLGAKIAHLAEAAAGPARAVRAGGQHGRPARRRGLRRLHQHRPVHRRLPQGDPARRDRHAEPRLPARDHRRAAPTHRLNQEAAHRPRRVRGCIGRGSTLTAPLTDNRDCRTASRHRAAMNHFGVRDFVHKQRAVRLSLIALAAAFLLRIVLSGV